MPGPKLFALVLALLLYSTVQLRAQQKVFSNQVFNPKIKTVELYNRNKEQSIPVITLHSNEELLLGFDDLQGDRKDYYYTIEHCDVNWKSSQLSPVDYLQSFNEDRITNYFNSINTLQQYTHYELIFPNATISPKIDGNYILKVYEEGDPSRIIITRRFYVLSPLVTLSTELVASSQVNNRTKNQKVNLTVSHPQLTISNPYTDVKLIVMQNGRPDKQQTINRPAIVRQGQLIYNDPKTLEFEGGNEFRKFDFRSLRLQTERVEHIYKDSVNTVQLLPDQPNTDTKYSYLFDENGNFFIRNQDGQDNRTEADYAYVTFTLESVRPSPGVDVYLVGQFNNYQLNQENRLLYDESQTRFYGSIYLKQGLYDYQYVWAEPSGTAEANSVTLESSFFETKNAYQAFLYYRRPGSRWDQLVGYQEFNK